MMATVKGKEKRKWEREQGNLGFSLNLNSSISLREDPAKFD